MNKQILRITVLLITLIVLVFTSLTLLGPYIQTSLYGEVGYTEYCTHEVSGTIQIRLAYTPYSRDSEIDPNNWQDSLFAHDLMPMGVINIPSIDYEVSQDGGMTWTRFWRFPNSNNYFPECDAFDSLDAETFWVWTRSWFVITHDGGTNWMIQDVQEDWGANGNIDYVSFENRDTGQIVFIPRSTPDPMLLTTDGGRSWYPDPDFQPIDG